MIETECVKEEWGGKWLNYSSVQVQATGGPSLSGKAKDVNHSKQNSEMAPNLRRAKKTIFTHNHEGRQRALQSNYHRTGLRKSSVRGHDAPICRWSPLAKSGTWEAESEIKELRNKVCFYKEYRFAVWGRMEARGLTSRSLLVALCGAMYLG